MKKLLIFICSMALLMGCGSSDNSGGGNKDGYNINVAVMTDNSQYAITVCFDRDDDKQCNNNDVYAEHAVNGLYALKGIESDESVGLLAELTPIKPGTSALQAVGKKYIMESPAGQNVISPLTTIVKGKMEANPSTSLKAAQDEVKSALGINSAVDLFDAVDAVAASSEGDKVFDVLSLMFDALRGLGIEFSNGLMLFIYANVDDQLMNIGSNNAEDIINNCIGNKSKDELEQEIQDTINPPAVMTMKDYFDTNPGNDFLTLMYAGDYSLHRLAYTPTTMRQDFIDINDYLTNGKKSALGDPEPAKIVGTAFHVLNSSHPDVTEIIPSIIITPLKDRIVKANASFNNYAISGFDDTAAMYSYDVEHRFAPENVDIDCLRANISNSYSCGESNYSEDAEKTGSVIKGGDYGYVGIMRLKENNKCEWIYPADSSETYVFELPVPFTLAGNYTQTGSGSNMTIRCDTADGGTFVYLSTSADEASGVFAEYRITGEKFIYRVFNDSAMKTIAESWDMSFAP